MWNEYLQRIDNTRGDWAFPYQADEVMHENSLPVILDAIKKYDTDKKVDGFILFPFIRTQGDYFQVRNTRRVHKHEIRLFRNDKLVRAYKDSQGFRKYQNN